MVQGMDLNSKHVLLWGTKQVEMYNITDVGATMAANLKLKAHSMALHGDVMYAAVGDHVQTLNMQVCTQVCRLRCVAQHRLSHQGTVTHTISFTETEGQPAHLHVLGNHLAVATNTGLVKVFDLSRREPREVCPGLIPHVFASII